MRTVTDDLGHEVRVGEVRRVVSLVPSLTETIADLDPSLIVGATQWCTHPAGLRAARIGGTKKVDHDLIRALRPDIVVANKEENREADVASLRAAGLAVYVTAPDTLDDALSSIARLVLAMERPRPHWLDVAARTWAHPVPDLVGMRAACFIWRKPWMAVGSATFSGDLLARLGLVNVVTEPRYPKIHLPIDADLILLPDEPYEFSLRDGPEAFEGQRCALFEGRYLTWYGPSLVAAKSVIGTAARGPVMRV